MENKYLIKLFNDLQNIDETNFAAMVEILNNARINKKRIFIIGNGGSASTAAHFVCDLKNINIKLSNKINPVFDAISLTDNIALITAISNDYCYDDVFLNQLKNFITTDDILIAITASGNSLNILKAVDYAKSKKAFVIGLIGFEGGKLKDLSDFSIISMEKNYGIAEDIHLITEHIVTQSLYEKLQ